MRTEIAIALTSSSWSSGSEGASVAEITPQPGQSRTTTLTKTSVTVGVNSAPKIVPVMPGQYTVRLFLPNGEVQAESVAVAQGQRKEVSFQMKPSPHEWLGSETAFGSVQRLPVTERADALESAAVSTDRPDPFAVRLSRSSHRSAFSTPRPEPEPDLWAQNASVMLTKAAGRIRDTVASIERISGRGRVPKMEGWRWLSRIDRGRPIPDAPLGEDALVRWWTGAPEPGPTPLRIDAHDERNARLVAESRRTEHALLTGELRAFAAVRDPTGLGHYAVLPEAWIKTSRSAYGQPATARVLMTVIVDPQTRQGEASEPARWRCSSSVDDVEAMTMLGFLYSGQSSAAETLVANAQEMLFEKTENPIAAAAGAYALLTHANEENARQRPRWRDWIRNLYQRFPQLPDGAITMAQMYMRYGDGDGPEEDLDVERLRGYALEAVRRGLPHLSMGITILTEVLMVVVQDDRSHNRQSADVETTARAFQLVPQLGRVIETGEFFTVLRFNGWRT